MLEESLHSETVRSSHWRSPLLCGTSKLTFQLFSLCLRMCTAEPDGAGMKLGRSTGPALLLLLVMLLPLLLLLRIESRPVVKILLVELVLKGGLGDGEQSLLPARDGGTNLLALRLLTKLTQSELDNFSGADAFPFTESSSVAQVKPPELLRTALEERLPIKLGLLLCTLLFQAAEGRIGLLFSFSSASPRRCGCNLFIHPLMSAL
mmetsp:Transcript_7527/g.11233  ORF Transcript_7527/g.11233 Transcript_7527/m.11233 type:complete len:206 (-) Transcript_7527:137-754(-)